MTKRELLNNVFQLGILGAIAILASPDVALAAGDSIGTSINEMTTQDVSSLPAIIGAVGYVGGAALGISGALKLKAHAENPAQEKMAPGIARLLAGGALVALPTLLATLTATTHIKGTQTFQPIAPITGG